VADFANDNQVSAARLVIEGTALTAMTCLYACPSK
jgi:hypothetical protein